jgi:solute carrier family 15 (oligopeptide transporter), member 1
MRTYFSLFYAAINSGSLISTLLTPILRQEVACAGQDTCYPAAFGVPAALMVVAIRKSFGIKASNFPAPVFPRDFLNS